VAFVRLWQQDRLDRAHPTVLARFGAAHVRDGRASPTGSTAPMCCPGVRGAGMVSRLGG
jgi:hypothetical protein